MPPVSDLFSRSRVWAPRVGPLHGSRWIYAVVATLLLAVFVGVGLFFVGAIGFVLAATLAGLGAFALRNERRTAAALARSSERLQLLHQIDRALIAATAPAEIAEAVLPRLRDLLGVPRVIVNLFDLAAGEVEWLAAVGRRQLHVGPGVRFPLRLMGDRATRTPRRFWPPASARTWSSP